MQQLTASQVNAQVPINENFETLEHQSVYGKRHPVTTGLTWGYYGGRWGGFSVADGTLVLTNATTNYIVVQRSNGAISVSTSDTNWNNTTSYARVYKIVTAGSAVSSVEDHRSGPNGVHGATAPGSAVLTTKGDLLSRSSSAEVRLPVGTNGHVLTADSAETSGLKWAAPAEPIQCIPIACGDETTAITAGAAKVTFRMPFAFTLTAVRASLTTAQASGSIFTIDINESGSSVISTKLTIDNTEKTSTTAATAAVISDSALADDAEITIDVDQVGDGTAAGLKVYLIGRKA